MQIIVHRRNSVAELIETNEKYGVEVDVRTLGDRLIIHHDPYVQGVSFDEWIISYIHKTLILNVKEEGLESRLISVMESCGISDYFFLDQSFPYLIKTSNTGESRCAVRVSEYESVDTALSLAGKVDWVWVDSFSKFSMDRSNLEKIKRAGFKICIVSPELHGRDPRKEIEEIASIMDSFGIEPDAVCTKFPEIWEGLVNNL